MVKKSGVKKSGQKKKSKKFEKIIIIRTNNFLGGKKKNHQKS